MQIIYENLRQLRQAKGLSQEALAQLTGYTSRSSIAKIEKGLVDLPQSKLEQLAKALGTTVQALTGWADTSASVDTVPDYSRETAAMPGAFFKLQIHESSMEPRIAEGDCVIVHRQDDAESGELVIARIHGKNDACRRLHKYAGGIILLASNPRYEPLVFTDADIANQQVTILGRVVELRARF